MRCDGESLVDASAGRSGDSARGAPDRCCTAARRDRPCRLADRLTRGASGPVGRHRDSRHTRRCDRPWPTDTRAGSIRRLAPIGRGTSEHPELRGLSTHLWDMQGDKRHRCRNLAASDRSSKVRHPSRRCREEATARLPVPAPSCSCPTSPRRRARPRPDRRDGCRRSTTRRGTRRRAARRRSHRVLAASRRSGPRWQSGRSGPSLESPVRVRRRREGTTTRPRRAGSPRGSSG